MILIDAELALRPGRVHERLHCIRMAPNQNENVKYIAEFRTTNVVFSHFPTQANKYLEISMRKIHYYQINIFSDRMENTQFRKHIIALSYVIKQQSNGMRSSEKYYNMSAKYIVQCTAFRSGMPSPFDRFKSKNSLIG